LKEGLDEYNAGLPQALREAVPASQMPPAPAKKAAAEEGREANFLKAVKVEAVDATRGSRYKVWLHSLRSGQDISAFAGDENMQTILPSEFKRQMVLMVDGSPHVVEDMHTSGTAQTRHRLHTRLRHLTTGRLIDRVFAENERVPVAPLETRRATYSYAKADGQVFMDIETFDEFEFSNEQIGGRRLFLKENEEYKALRLDGKLLDIVLPPQIPLKVVETAPPARAGLTTSWKEAKLETGLQIMVPLFIANGDIIRVDTAGKKYLGKE
jgi:elongation factor P